jgi:glycosyltransferase involved in cell wall biosynthesis
VLSDPVSLVVDEGYLPLDRFVAAVAAADVVACPYRVGSQSAVLALAHALGRPTVATDVGGLPELASVVVEPEDPAALAQGIEEALRTTTVPPVRRPPAEALAPFLAASGLRAEESTPVPTQG